MTKRKIIIANWKMNQLFDDVDNWLENFKKYYDKSRRQLKDVDIVVCPPVYIIDYIDGELMNLSLPEIEKAITQNKVDADKISEEELNKLLYDNRMFAIGAQDCHFEEKGAFTGDISANMLKEIGCEYIILGHSERRKYHHESDEIVAKKVRNVIKSGLTSIICVGENLETRQAGRHKEFVANQIIGSVPRNIEFEDLIIAYEPVWSIGTGITAKTEEISEMADFIAEIIRTKFKNVKNQSYILYGGSANSKNSAEILAVKNIDGLLVGSASLEAEEFFQIVKTSLLPLS